MPGSFSEYNPSHYGGVSYIPQQYYQPSDQNFYNQGQAYTPYQDQRYDYQPVLMSGDSVHHFYIQETSQEQFGHHQPQEGSVIHVTGNPESQSNRRKCGRPPKPPTGDKIEDEKIRIRRQKNSFSSAQCRKRRENKAFSLEKEFEQLRTTEGKLEQQIARLAQIEKHYKHILQQHSQDNNCQKQKADSSLLSKHASQSSQWMQVAVSSSQSPALSDQSLHTEQAPVIKSPVSDLMIGGRNEYRSADQVVPSVNSAAKQSNSMCGTNARPFKSVQEAEKFLRS